MNRFPQSVGPYVPERLLGRGAMAAVYLCRSPSGEPVALKWLDQPFPPLLRRFEQEIRALERLDHPGIVRLLDHGVHEERPYLVMEYIDGVDLQIYATKLYKRPPTERYARCRQIGAELAEALTVLHARGLIHRDIKPSNVMVEEDGRVVLTDFGVVKDLAEADATAVGLVIGTYAYAAPEQLSCTPIDARADLFGLGATLYYLLTLRRPFESTARRPDAVPPLPSLYDPQIPVDLEGVIMRLMALDPAERYPDAGAAGRALATGSAGGVPIAGRQKLLEQVVGCLNRVQGGEAVVVQPVGPAGTSREWVFATLLQGAQRRQIPTWNPEEGLDALRERLAAGEAFLGVLAPGMEVPPGLPVEEIALHPLGVADVRRTLVGTAPRTPDHARVAERLHRLTGGLPAILVPLLSEYTEDERLALPEEIPEPFPVTAFFAGLDLDEIETLAALAALDAPAGAQMIEEITHVPAEPALATLAARGLVEPIGERYRVRAALFATAALQRAPDPETLLQRAAALRQAQPPAPADLPARLAAVGEASARGDLAAARAQARKLLARAQGAGDRALECQALCQLGQVLLDLGLNEEATQQLADATALAKAASLERERQVSQALRARAALEGRPGRPAAAAAIDRLLPLVREALGRAPEPEDALVLGIWAQAAGTLGDASAWQRAARAATDRAAAASPLAQARAALAVALGAAGLGHKEEALALLAPVEASPYALLRWEAGRLRAALTGEHPPPTSPLAYGLAPHELAALKRRAVYVGGKARYADLDA